MKIENLRFSYFDNGTEKNIFNGLNLQSDSGIICFMGPSGCGKTTLLHIIAGLIRPCDGTVSNFPANCSVMFQEDRLLPWLNAWANGRNEAPRGPCPCPCIRIRSPDPGRAFQGP